MHLFREDSYNFAGIPRRRLYFRRGGRPYARFFFFSHPRSYLLLFFHAHRRPRRAYFFAISHIVFRQEWSLCLGVSAPWDASFLPFFRLAAPLPSRFTLLSPTANRFRNESPFCLAPTSSPLLRRLPSRTPPHGRFPRADFPYPRPPPRPPSGPANFLSHKARLFLSSCPFFLVSPPGKIEGLVAFLSRLRSLPKSPGVFIAYYIGPLCVRCASFHQTGCAPRHSVLTCSHPIF